MQIGVDNDSNKKSSLSLGKRCNKLQKAKDHPSVLLNILAKCKNSPVWPYELITCQNYSKQLTSIQILNEFVSNLQAFLQLCFSTKQVSSSFKYFIFIARISNIIELRKYNRIT